MVDFLTVHESITHLSVPDNSRCRRGPLYLGLRIEVRVVGDRDAKSLLEKSDTAELNALSQGLSGVGPTTFEYTATRVRCVSTWSIVGLLVDSSIQHSSTNSQVPSPNPICSASTGFVGRTPVMTWYKRSYSPHCLS